MLFPRFFPGRHLARAVFSGVLALAATAAIAAQAAPLELQRPTRLAPPIGPQLRIVAFGSSSTEGYGSSGPSHTYPAQLQMVLSQALPGWRVQVINRGIGGEDADAMMRRLQADVIGRRPQIVIWQTGSNDPLHHVPLVRFEKETRDGIAAMQAAGIKVVLMEPQWCPRLEAVANAGAYRETLRRIGDDMKVAVVRRSDLMHDWIREGVLTRKQMLAPDGLHMRDSGYALLARSVAPTILTLQGVPAVVEYSALKHAEETLPPPAGH